MSQKQLNVAMIGYKFMGRAHSQAWLNAPRFFNLDSQPVTKVVCGRNAKAVSEFAKKWSWQETETDWRKVISRKDIDIVDIAAPPILHFEIAMAAIEAGKHIFCEKPLALNYEQTKLLAAAAQKSNITHYLNHNYRRCPAITYAKQLIDEGRIGQIYHWRGCYLQDWIMDPEFPMVWHLQKELAGAGPHADLNSHSVDLARYLVGEIKSVQAMMTTFIKERPIVENASSFNTGSEGTQQKATQMGTVDVDDAAFMICEFENGALGSFETSRFAGGRKNFNCFEIYGSKGSLLFNLERMNELEFFDRTDPAVNAGFKTILVTEGDHPYYKNWWPAGHTLGYEHLFTHAVADFIQAVTHQTEIKPNFSDGMRCMQVLEAGLQSAEAGRRVEVASI